ncbi:MAG: nitronate monooxygenase [Armatimonadetes bacterium]|nr:nitronate monooxygenase [Armatimonadota bacterium]
MTYPQIIQGGMGVAVSDWRLARAVASRGQLGVVSGTALDTVLAYRLQLGDIGGHIRQALDHFPIKEMAERILERYFIPGGKAIGAAFKSKPVFSLQPGKALEELTILGNFVEVWLAKHGHNGPVGINLLEKIQLPTVPSLYGAMLAGVDYVLMGAGIPRQIPGILDSLSKGLKTEMRVDLAGGDSEIMTFDPAAHGFGEVKRPTFLAIVSSASLATMLAKKCSPPVDGFVVEHHTAGGHNAPPRGAMQLNENLEPIYGERDEPEFSKFVDLGLPFWLAGSYGTAEGLQKAREAGAKGIQVGTGFAFCNESGMDPEIKARVIQQALRGEARVHTDAKASPTGFPFKVVQLEGTMAQAEVYEKRKRICDLGYLRESYRMENGKIGFRCPSEPEDDFLRKGGDPAELAGRKCICNGLMATIGLGQVRDGVREVEIVTAGDQVANLTRFLRPGETSYSASDVIDYLLGKK